MRDRRYGSCGNFQSDGVTHFGDDWHRRENFFTLNFRRFCGIVFFVIYLKVSRGGPAL
jgi:hypothetical protein